MVLAEYALQAASGEKNRPGTAFAGNTGLLPKMQSGPGCPDLCALSAESPAPGQTVCMASPGTQSAVPHPFLYFLFRHFRSPSCHPLALNHYRSSIRLPGPYLHSCSSSLSLPAPRPSPSCGCSLCLRRLLLSCNIFIRYVIFQKAGENKYSPGSLLNGQSSPRESNRPAADNSEDSRQQYKGRTPQDSIQLHPAASRHMRGSA